MADSGSGVSGIGLKSFGYALSVASVFLLGVAGWDGASRHSLTKWALIAGMGISVVGIGIRWWVYFAEHRERSRRGDGR